MTYGDRRPAPARGERGVALVMTIWIFMALTVLVAEFSRGMRDDAIATQNMAEEAQARGVALAGMNQAIYRALRTREQPPPLPAQQPVAGPGAGGPGAEEAPEEWVPDGSWREGSYGGGTYAVRLIDEGGKIGLNRSDEALLRHVFTNLGLDPDTQDVATDGILDWRDSDDLRRLHGAESEYYLGLPEPYAAKNGPYESVDELLLVRGISRELFYGVVAGAPREQAPEGIALKDIFSVFNKSATINVRTAPPAVLQALLGGEEKDVQEIIAARDADRAASLTLLRARLANLPVARRLVDRGPTTLAIDVWARMEGGHIQARLGTVVDLTEDGDGFHVVRWYDKLPAL